MARTKITKFPLKKVNWPTRPRKPRIPRLKEKVSGEFYTLELPETPRRVPRNPEVGIREPWEVWDRVTG